MSTSQQILKSLLLKRQQRQADSMISSSPVESQQTISNSAISSLNQNPNEFNPLLCNEPKTREALLACAILYLNETLSNHPCMWREISEWIGGYDYIMPADRTMLDELAILLIKAYGYEKFRQYQYTILTNFSLQTQQDLIEYLKTGNQNGPKTETT